MANQNIEMSKLRQIFKLYSQHQGTRVISAMTGISRNTVKKYIAEYKRLQRPWEELSTLNDTELNEIFCSEPPVEIPERLKELYAFFPYAERKLRRKGMTLQLLWKEYCEKHPQAYQSTGFYKHFALWQGQSQPSMRMVHKVGDKMFIDFAGKKLNIVDADTGEIIPVEVLVAILGASQLTYVEAVESQEMEDLIMACQNALHYFGGSPAAVVPDNLKSAVTKGSLYEPQMNENFEAFADHYGMVVLPTRIAKPQDKSLVEGMVKITYNRVYTHLYDKTFHSVKELNEAILIYLQSHNQLSFLGRDYSRREQFDEMEKQMLQPLPAKLFEMRQQSVVTVAKNGHIGLHCDKHYYSVPYGFIGKKVKILYTKHKVDIYYKLEVIASHDRIKSPHQYTTLKEHMATYHQYLTDWNPGRFLEDAYKIHNDVGIFIDQVILRKPHPEQAYKSCQGILSFAKRLGNERLIRACQRAYQCGQFHYKGVENILLRNLDQFEIEKENPIPMPPHENIRGEEYYQ